MDLKGIGYLISTISVFFLGIVAWPKPEDPQLASLGRGHRHGDLHCGHGRALPVPPQGPQGYRARGP